MLRSMDEVVSYYEELANRPEGFSGALKLRTEKKSLSNDLAEFGLPRDYLAFVEKYEVEGAELGYFHFTSMKDKDVLMYLSNNNGENKNPVAPDDMLNVASHEADIILVRKGRHNHSDSSVYCLSHADGYSAVPVKLAHNIEQLVLIMSNLDKLFLENSEGGDFVDYDDAAKKFVEILRNMDPRLEDQMIKSWMRTCNLPTVL